jgi:hypothetical protein
MAAYAERGACALALLILLSPLLAPYHLLAVIPLLAGLWWEGAGSWLGGGLAALWLKICAAISGHSLDLWRVNGWQMTVGPIYERFHTANSLQTPLRLIEPFGLRLGRLPFLRGMALGTEVSYPAPAGLWVLFNLLQVLAWAAAGYVVSVTLDRLYAWQVARGRGWALSALSLGPGLVLIWAGYVAVPFWLQVAGPRWRDPAWLPALVLLSGFVAWCLDGLVRYLHRPVSPNMWAVRSAASPSTEDRALFSRKRVRDRGPVTPEPRRPFGRSAERASRGERHAESDRASDIMIELD